MNNPSMIKFHLQTTSVVGQDGGVLDTLKCERDCSSQVVENIITVFSCIPPMILSPKILQCDLIHNGILDSNCIVAALTSGEQSYAYAFLYFAFLSGEFRLRDSPDTYSRHAAIFWPSLVIA